MTSFEGAPAGNVGPVDPAEYIRCSGPLSPNGETLFPTEKADGVATAMALKSTVTELH
jgi:hypothetical protein